MADALRQAQNTIGTTRDFYTQVNHLWTEAFSPPFRLRRLAFNVGLSGQCRVQTVSSMILEAWTLEP